MKFDEKPPINIGIVGCGRATTVLHLPALQFVPGAKVVALADPDREALHRASKQLAVDHCVSDYRMLLDNQAIEAIAICAPVQFHVEIALAALDAGKHLFIEKPLALTLEDCDRLIDRAAGLPLQIMLGFNTRWHRLARQARALFQQGTLGHLEIVRSSLLTNYHKDLPEWRKRRISGGGVLLEMAMHHFDLWRYVLDEEVEEISAHSRSGTWEDESATVTARLSCGALASATFAECTSQNNSIEIYGRSGSLSVSFYRFDGLETATTSDIPGNIQARIRGLRRFAEELPKAIATNRQGGEWLQSYIEEWRHFVGSIRKEVPVECGLEDGRRALAVALAAMESAATGKAITIAKR
jgi:myo-inositol 2-dehydrogenase/D-chiro-inositol 1-dehydrogenase